MYQLVFVVEELGIEVLEMNFVEIDVVEIDLHLQDVDKQLIFQRKKMMIIVCVFMNLSISPC